MLSASVRCMWSCTPRDAAFFSQRVCSERGVAAAPLLTRPVSVTNVEIICDTPPRASAGLASLALALNVYDAVGPTCDDKLHNGDEAGVDCGGASCARCAPSCYDGVQNGEETGVDCGGGHATADGYTHCPYCIPACDAPGADGQDCLLPRSRRPRRSGHATLLTVHGEDFRKAGELITYTKQVLGRDVEFTHNALPRCVLSSHGNRYETPATVHNSSFITCRAPLGNLVGCYTLLVSLDVCDFHADVLASCPASKQEGLAYSDVPTTQYAGYTSDAYAYEGDFIHSGLQFKFYDHPAPTFAGRALWGASRLVDVVPKAGFDLGARAVVNTSAPPSSRSRAAARCSAARSSRSRSPTSSRATPSCGASSAATPSSATPSSTAATRGGGGGGSTTRRGTTARRPFWRSRRSTRRSPPT